MAVARSAATEHEIAVVQHRGLAGRRSPDRLVGLDDPAPATSGLRAVADEPSPRPGRAVTDADVRPERLASGGRVAGHERHALELDRGRLEVLAAGRA
jgi:hypothetical protein